MRVCVGTIVHHPDDARIAHRQIRALLDAGHQVTYIAPFTHCNVTPPPEIRALDVPRAVGLRRARALRAARSALAEGCRDADLLLVHDIDLLLALPRRRPVTVLDVHEDTRSVLEAEAYPPGPLRAALPPLVAALERRAERRLHLILADESLRGRFPGGHPVVPDHTYVPAVPPPPPGDDRLVYVGRLSRARGAAGMIELARRLRPYGIRLDLIGSADPGVRPLLRDAQRQGLLDWFGHVPNTHALRMAEGALAGLSLTHDVPGLRDAVPPRVMEYMARGIPVITTPSPGAAGAVTGAGCGLVIPFPGSADRTAGDAADAAVRAVLDLRDDPARRAAMGARGHAEALRRFHWPVRAPRFVAQLERWARAPHRAPVLPRGRALPA
ncbi:glycosyltransferase family protein [Microtetraspora niveoalba]|uniref:glycosyltransferase family protein n=1 Tax=Microtetraspora niveoalba TaxID=46175 RepID=UPI000A4903CD|nr:glycosyltransferase [Microtetraspora niveoalba]